MGKDQYIIKKGQEYLKGKLVEYLKLKWKM